MKASVEESRRIVRYWALCVSLLTVSGTPATQLPASIRLACPPHIPSSQRCASDGPATTFPVAQAAAKLFPIQSTRYLGAYYSRADDCQIFDPSPLLCVGCSQGCSLRSFSQTRPGISLSNLTWPSRMMAWDLRPSMP